MTNKSLPLLYSLQAIAANPAIAALEDGALKMQLEVAGRLIARLIVEESAAAALRTEALAAYLDALARIESASVGDEAALGLIEEMKNMSREPGAWEACNRIAGDLQQALLARGSAEARALCGRLAAIEADYRRKIFAAVAAAAVPAANDETQTAQARNTKAFDPTALAGFLADAFPHEAGIGIAESRFLSGGYSKYTMGITLTGTTSLPADIVLRGDAEGMFGGASVVDEYRLLQVLHAHGVCVPKPLALEAGGRAFGSPFMLLEKKSGGSLGHMYSQPPRDAAVCRDIAAKLARIHQVPLDALEGRLAGVDTSSSATVLASIERAWNNWRALDMPSPAFSAAFRYLRDNADLNDAAPRGIVHGDYGINNLLIEEGRVTAVLDWEFAHVGNPAYDLGYFHFMAERLASWRDFLAAYAEAGGRVPDARQLDYSTLLAATLLGTMVCQTVAAHGAGSAANIPVAAAVGSGYYEESITRIAGVLNRVL